MMAGNTAVCNDTSEALDLFQIQGLYLKPVARLNISVALPQLKTPGKSISNWEVMEKLKAFIKPAIFISLKIIKSTLEFLRFEAEVDNKALLKTVICRIDSKTIKLSGFTEILKVRAAEAKVHFPQRHDWDSFFRDAKNMNEMKSGERPDTVHFKDLPSRWFANKKAKNKDTPSEFVLKKVFEGYGEIRCVDIPMLDPYRKEMTASKKAGTIQTFSFGQDLTFEAFVQYKEYVGFDRVMSALRGMKLMYKEDENKAWTAPIKVDFDKSKHLSDRNIKRRRIERKKLEELEKEREDNVRREREDDERRREDDRRREEEEVLDRERKRMEKVERREEQRSLREQKRHVKREDQKRVEEEKRMQLKIVTEERKLLLVQRRLESIRLLTELFSRVKAIKVKEDLARREEELIEENKRRTEEERKKQEEITRRKEDKRKRKREKLESEEKELRDKILKNWQLQEERKQELQREELRRKMSGKKRLKSAIIQKR